jgi:hypothetical protein
MRYPLETEKSGRGLTSRCVRNSAKRRIGTLKKGCDRLTLRESHGGITFCLFALTIYCITFFSCTLRNAGSRFLPALGDHLSSP